MIGVVALFLLVKNLLFPCDRAGNLNTCFNKTMVVYCVPITINSYLRTGADKGNPTV